MLGGDPQKAIDAIAKKMNTSRYNAGRLVMTESTYFSSEAQKKCFEDLDVENYEIVATLDSHTSEICRDLDGKVFPVKDYEAGVTAPPFHVKCRSTTVPYFDDDFDQIGERAARDADGKTYYVPADMTYREWEKSFVDGGDKNVLTNSGGSGIINMRGEKTMLKVNTGGRRNEKPLTPEQIETAIKYAEKLGMPRERIYYVDYDCTAYGTAFDLLRIGTDVVPSEQKQKNPNSNVSMRGAIAHEIVGHRNAALAGLSQTDDLLEEVQASIRAAYLAAELTYEERIILMRDGLYRLRSAGIELQKIKKLLNLR